MSSLRFKAGFLQWCCAICASLVILGCEKPLSAEQKKQKAQEAIGSEASFTAAIVVSAARSCVIAGVYELEKCVQIKNPLLTDQSARTMAEFAVEQRASFWQACQAEFSSEYCGQLIQEAVDVEYKKPRAASNTG